MELLTLSDISSWLLWAIALWLIYKYLTKDYDYWKSKGVPYVKPYPIIGSFGQYFFKHFHVVGDERYKKYGRIYGSFEGRSPVLSVADPELLRDIFVKDFNVFPERRTLRHGKGIDDNFLFIMGREHWKDVRSVVTPAFTSGKLRKLSQIFNECCEILNNNLMAVSKTGRAVDCKRVFGAFIMDVICSSAFGIKIDSYNESSHEYVTAAAQVFNNNFNWRFGMAFLFPTIRKWFKVRIFSPKTLNLFRDVSIQLIQERKKTGKTRADFLQLIIDSTNQEDTTDDLDSECVNMGHEETNRAYFQTTKKKDISLDALVAQCITFFVAGYNTTASVLSLILYCLAQNPHCQELLIREVDETFEKFGEFDFDITKEMEYLDRVISESLRLYAPAVRAERKAVEDYKLGNTGITIRKGVIVTIPIYSIHHDAEYYPDPYKFDPDRFLPENKSARNPYTYLPFGAGPRNCIGMRFAMMEIKICLSQVLRKFRFKISPETKVPPQFYSRQILLHPTEIKLTVEPRKDVPVSMK